MSTWALLASALLASPGEQGAVVVSTPFPPPLDRRLGSRLQAVERIRRMSGDASARAAASRMGLRVDSAGRADLLAHQAGQAVDADVLHSAGATVISQDGDAWLLSVPLPAIPRLALALPDGAWLAAPAPAVPSSVSEGVALTGADAAHAQGADGAGRRLAVIDVGFAGLEALVASGELPEPIKRRDYTGEGLESGSAHGVAVALVAHQMAPAADLILIKIAHVAHFKKAVQYATKKGADVVCAAIGFPGANFSDGTGAAAKAVNKARKKGVLPVVAAGNFGDRHWIGPFSDEDKDKFLDFSPGDEGLSFQAGQGDTIEVLLVWDEFPHAKRDLALTLHYLGSGSEPLAPSQATLVATSDVVQKGGPAPIELIQIEAVAPGHYAAFVQRKKGKPKRVAVFTSHPIDDGNAIPASSIVTPADASGALSVGAVVAGSWFEGPPWPGSSRGPTTAGIDKPDLVAPSEVQNAAITPFSGTSAAAPHVAGAACALLSVQPHLDADDLAARILAYADPFAGVGAEAQGAGRLDLHGDFLPPAPNPPQFDPAALAITDHSITLVAAPTSDDSPPLLYRFEHVGKNNNGADDSPWQSDPAFTDDGLKPDRLYRYRLYVKDSALFSNQSAPSDELKIRTFAADPPAPKIKGVGPTHVKIQILRGANRKKVEMALFSVTHDAYVRPDGKLNGNTPVFKPWSKWPVVKVKGLTPLTSYEFRTVARNLDGVETSMSPPAFAITDP